MGYKEKFKKNYKKNHFSNKQNSTLKKNNLFSIEHILHLLQVHNGILHLNELSLNPSHMEYLIKKIDMLSKLNIVSYDDSTQILKLELTKINSSLNNFHMAKIIKNIASNHFFVNLIYLLENKIIQEECIIENLHMNLKHKEMLVKVSISGEKIILTPIFYLDSPNPTIAQNTNLSPDKSDDVLNISKGVYFKQNNNDIFIPLNFKSRTNLTLIDAPNDLMDGSIVNASIIKNKSTINSTEISAKYLSTIATDKLSTSLSMLSVHQYDIPFEFSQASKEIAINATQCTLDNRLDLTNLPLVTIDDEDAKDFDDAIYVEKIPNTNNFKLYVAIADVAYYVTPNSPLDNEAKQRGNSVYLPGLVIPMLPKELSNGWCSLNPQENRGCLVAIMTINKNGLMEDYSFQRALMKSKARLTYKEVQNALDKTEITPNIEPLLEHINNLHQCYELLKNAKIKRNALELSSKEIKIVLNKENDILDIKLREHLTSHQIVEECMICANVAAAKFLKDNGMAQKGLVTYRIHEQPSLSKIDDYINVIKTFNIFAKSPNDINGEFFNKILSQHKDEYYYHSLSEATLRCQSQAKYDITNIGHFGLALKEYVHFTSPIRRYSDLMIHRAILHVINNQEFNYNRIDVSAIANHISITERIAFNAENNAKDRILTKWLSSKINCEFKAYISSITNSGMFISLIENGASGLIPMRTISNTYCYVDLEKHTIKDKSLNHVYKLGDTIDVILVEADEIRGLMVFKLKSSMLSNKNIYKKRRNN